MSKHVYVWHETMPDPHERICSFCGSMIPGNIMCLPTNHGFKSLDVLSYEDRIAALECIIAELDKEECGMYNWEYAKNADWAWSKGEESKRDFKYYKDVIKFLGLTNDHWWATKFRDRLREEAIRFYLYLKAGYHVDFEA